MDITYHEYLATKWAVYNDIKGKARPKEVARVMAQLSTEDLTRMLGERGQL